MEEVLIYKAILDSSAALSSIKQMRDANALIKKDLSEVGEVGSAGYNRIAQEAARTGKSIDDVTKQLQQTFASNKQSVDEFNRSLANTSNGSGSIVALRQEVINLKNQYIGLSEVERNSAEGKAMQKDLLEKTNNLKQLEAEIGITSRNVGNYGEAFKGAFAELDLGGKVTGFLKENVAGADAVMNVFSQTSEGLKAVIGQSVQEIKLQIAALQTQTVATEESVAATEANVVAQEASAEATVASAGASGVATVAVNILKVALLSLPFILIATAIAAVVAYFIKFDGAAEKLEQVVGGLSAVFNTLVVRAAQLGSAISKVFSGDFAGAAEEASNAVSGVGQAMSDAYDSGVKYKELLQDIEDAERAYSVSASESEKEIARLVLQSKNRTLSGSDRIKAIDEANALEEESLAQFKAINDEKLQAELVRFTASKKISQDELVFLASNLGTKKALNGEEVDELVRLNKLRQELGIQDSDLTKIAEVAVKRNEVEKQSLQLTEKNENRRDSLLQEIEKKKEAAAKAELDRIKKLQDAEKADAENRIKLMSDGLEKQLAILAEKEREEIQKAKEIGANVSLVEQAFNQERLKLISDFTAKQKEELEKQEATLKTLIAQGTKTAIDDEKVAYQQRLDALVDYYDKRKIAELKGLGFSQEEILQLQDQQNKAIEAINLNHQKNLQNIEADEALNRLGLQDIAFAKQKTLRAQAFSEEILGLTTSENEKKRLKNEFQEKDLLESKEFLQRKLRVLLVELQSAQADPDQLLSEDAKAKFESGITSVREQITGLNVALESLGKDEAGQKRTMFDIMGVNDEQVQKATQVLQFAAQAVAQVGQILANISAARIADLENEKERALSNTTLSAQARVATEKKYNEAIKEEKRKAAKEQQAIAIVQAIIGGALAIVQGFSQLGPIGGAIAAVLIAAVTATQVALIAKQKYKRGTVLQGPSHENGGVQLFGSNGSYYGEAEGGEPILTAGVSKNPRALAVTSAINEAFGGVSFTGVKLPQALKDSLHSFINPKNGGSSIASNPFKFAAGGFAQPFPITTVNQINNADVVQELRSMREAIFERPSYVSVVDINQGQTDVSRVEVGEVN